MAVDDTRPDLTESIKLGFETTKQLTTLNAGSIVVIGTFISNIFPTDGQGTLAVPWYIKVLVGAAFVGFGASLILSALGMYAQRASLQTYLTNPEDPVRFFSRGYVAALAPPFFFFSLGLICFGAAVLLNVLF